MGGRTRTFLGWLILVFVLGFATRKYCDSALWLRTSRVASIEPSPVPKDVPGWMACHQQHVDTIAAADAAPQGAEVIFYGDSITESWLGTDLCGPCQRCEGVPAVFARHYSKFNASVMAVGGDQVAHLMWRLQNGEAPLVNKPKVVVLNIGTNDLGAAAWEAGDIRIAEEAVMRAVPGVTLRVLRTLYILRDLLPGSHAILMALLQPSPPSLPAASRVLRTLYILRDLLPGSHVILMALLPRGGTGGGDKYYKWPSVFTQPFDMVNAHFIDYTRLDPRLHFLDCGERFLTPDQRSIDAALMPDALHPSPAGYELLAQCLDPLVTKLVQRPLVEAAAGRFAEAGAAAGAAEVGVKVKVAAAEIGEAANDAQLAAM